MRTASRKLQAMSTIDAAPMKSPKATLPPSSPCAPAKAGQPITTDSTIRIGPIQASEGRGRRKVGTRRFQSDGRPSMRRQSGGRVTTLVGAGAGFGGWFWDGGTVLVGMS